MLRPEDITYAWACEDNAKTLASRDENIALAKRFTELPGLSEAEWFELMEHYHQLKEG